MQDDIRLVSTQPTKPQPTIPQQIPPPQPVFAPPIRSKKKKLLEIIAVIVALTAIAAITVLLLVGYYNYRHKNVSKKQIQTKAAQPAQVNKTAVTPAVAVQGLQLDPNKNYGNKYANGLLPVGDKKYVSDAAKSGYVYTCAGYARNLGQDSGGAGSRGPWFTNNNTQYDINKKLQVQGRIMWQAQLSNQVNGASRNITTNDLPSHATGVFPVSAKDPAYTYDRNPNSIKGQTLSYVLNRSPQYGAPTCIGGQVGIMLTGIALYSAFDASGRDAGAWELQDSCGGHPEKSGTYHYHTLSSCVKDISVATVIGFALDGYPISGPGAFGGSVLSTSDLDECHGLTSEVILDGKKITTYHYVMTQDFPYSVGCYRSTAIQPPGQPAR